MVKGSCLRMLLQGCSTITNECCSKTWISFSISFNRLTSFILKAMFDCTVVCDITCIIQNKVNVRKDGVQWIVTLFRSSDTNKWKCSMLVLHCSIWSKMDISKMPLMIDFCCSCLNISTHWITFHCVFEMSRNSFWINCSNLNRKSSCNVTEFSNTVKYCERMFFRLSNISLDSCTHFWLCILLYCIVALHTFNYICGSKVVWCCCVVNL